MHSRDKHSGLARRANPSTRLQQEVGSKMQVAPETVTSEDAAKLHSREARAMGQANPPPGSISADAEHLAAVNEGRAMPQTNGQIDPATQSAADRVQNLQNEVAKVAPKMVSGLCDTSVLKSFADAVSPLGQRS